MKQLLAKHRTCWVTCWRIISCSIPKQRQPWKERASSQLTKLNLHHQRAANEPFKVVGKAQATKSNLQNFRYRCLVVALIDVSEVLSQTLHACMNYERKKNLKIVSRSKYNWLIDGPNCNGCFGKRYGCGQLDIRGISYASKCQSTPFSWWFWHWLLCASAVIPWH